MRARSSPLRSALAIGRDTLRAVIGPRLKRVQRRIVSGGVLAIAAIRLVPIAPFTVVNLVAGASEIRIGAFVAGTILGMLPGWIVMSALGHQLMRIISGPSAADVALLAGVVVDLARACRRRAGRVREIREAVLSTVRVLTWNIHGTFGRNPRFDLARVVELIDRWDPQIVALQEVDSRRDGDDRIRSSFCSANSASTASARSRSPPMMANTGRC